MTNNNKKQTAKHEGVANMNNKTKEVEEAVSTIKAMNFKESNEQDVKIAEVVMSELTKQKELEHQLKIMELEAKKLMEENINAAKERQMKLENKYKVINKVSEAAVALGALATITTITCVTMTTGKDLRIEELRLGMDN